MTRVRNDDSAHKFAAARQMMIERDLIGRGIRAAAVLNAMAETPREEFVLPEDRHLAYADRALPISCGQTISQPYMVALMTELLKLSGREHVLEIGTGSGYQTAVLAKLAHDVVTIERHAELSAGARRRLEQLGLNNVVFRVGDGSQANGAGAPYDRILVTAAARRVPPYLVRDLCPGGIVVAPIGPRTDQTLIRGVKKGDELETEELLHCRFVPLIVNGGENEN